MKEWLISAGILGSPIVWFANYETQFALSPLACAWNSNAILLIVAAVALLLVAGSGVAAWFRWQTLPENSMPRGIAMSGMILSGSFLIVIVAQAIPDVMLGGCA
jgi:hypothetical protein